MNVLVSHFTDILIEEAEADYNNYLEQSAMDHIESAQYTADDWDSVLDSVKDALRARLLTIARSDVESYQG